MKLFEHLQKCIENESEVGEMEVIRILHSWYYLFDASKTVHVLPTQADVIVNEFQTNWNAFERFHSDVYLKHIKVKLIYTVIDKYI